MARTFRRTGPVLTWILILVLALTSCASTGIKTTGFKQWDIHSDSQAAYLADADYTKPHLHGAKGAAEMSKPVSPVFEWSYSEAAVEAGIDSVTLLISEDENLADAREYAIPAGETSFQVPDGAMNLKTGTRYYWAVRVALSDGSVIESKLRKFTTLEGIRNIGIEGVTNFRDMGGAHTTDGGTVRQGLLYRSGRFNEKFSRDLMITETGLEQVRLLGIRTDIDLRGDKEYYDSVAYYPNGYPVEGSETMVSPLGEDVRYVLIPRVWDNSMMVAPAGSSMMKEIFDVLCDESNYPIVFHCSIGTDRTGMAAFLINCVLRLSDEDIIRDYLFSNFGDIGSPRMLANFQTATRYIKNDFEGETYSEKGINYLLKAGVTPEQMEKLRSILVEY